MEKNHEHFEDFGNIWIMKVQIIQILTVLFEKVDDTSILMAVVCGLARFRFICLKKPLKSKICKRKLFGF